MKNMNEEIQKANGAQELDDDMMDGVAGGLVQLVNPSSSRTDNIVLNMRTIFFNKRACPVCSSIYVIPIKMHATFMTPDFTVVCESCGYSYGRVDRIYLKSNE
jgi:hypothetical protein